MTMDIRENLKNYIENKFDEVVELWETLEPIEKLKFYKDLLNYSIPKMNTIEQYEYKKAEPITGIVINVAQSQNND